MNDGMYVAPLVSRVEIIDSSGRAWVEYYKRPGATVSIQDDGRTIKVFVGEPVDS